MDKESSRALARIMTMEQVFEMEGWKIIVEELLNEIETIKGQCLESRSWEDVKFLQGKADQCLRLAYLDSAMANLKDQILGITDAAV